uniref:Uncharacterized protein n=1 Tax=Vitis vinifera TaxID=29760 RepID=F6HSF3_VITVI
MGYFQEAKENQMKKKVEEAPMTPFLKK